LRKFSEERTRKELIDPQLEQAGWYLRDHSKVKIEIPVDGYDAEPRNGVTDYCLYRENGETLTRQFESNITRYNHNAGRIRFLRAVQSVFLQKRHLETTDLYEPPLDMFGADAVER
jgi:type I site-specific restriction endonuclease